MKTVRDKHAIISFNWGDDLTYRMDEAKFLEVGESNESNVSANILNPAESL